MPVVGGAFYVLSHCTFRETLKGRVIIAPPFDKRGNRGPDRVYNLSGVTRAGTGEAWISTLLGHQPVPVLHADKGHFLSPV